MSPVPPASTASPEDGDARFARLGVTLALVFFLLDGLLRASYVHLGARAVGASPPLVDAVLSELTGSFATLAVFFVVVIPVSRRFPIRGPRWFRQIPPHLGALVIYSILKTLLMWGMRIPLWPLAGIGRYDYGDLGYRFPMEASQDVLSYGALVAAVHVWDAWKARRDRELREARLEARLNEARLQALQAQLQPHFLFNALNVISSVLYDEPERADRLIGRLSELLRASLAVPDGGEVTVEDELTILDRYVELMQARYGPRLEVGIDVDDDTRRHRVPAFLLQPLVENAIRHGIARRAGPGRIQVRVGRSGPALRLEVLDDGPGVAGDPEDAVGRGVGLANTRARLEHLYGDRASLTLRNRDEGGLRVEVRIPAEGGDPSLAADAPPLPPEVPDSDRGGSSTPADPSRRRASSPDPRSDRTPTGA